MTRALISKLLRDVRLQFCGVALLLAGFQTLWARVTQRITEEIVPALTQHLPLPMFLNILFKGPGQLVQTLMGGSDIRFDNPLDVLSIGYVHPLMQTILCVWAVGRAAGAIAGEIDRGTMELLLAQPLARFRLILAHLCVDLLLIPVLCLSLWAGTWLGVWTFGQIDLTTLPAQKTEESSSHGFSLFQPKPPPEPEKFRANPLALFPALANVAALVFAVSGYTIALSAAGRFRGKVMGIAVFVTLLQFLVNVIGQMWDAFAYLRPFTVFFYYQPQQIVLQHVWSVDVGQAWQLESSILVPVLPVLLGVGILGYGWALWTFCRRDLPAPL